jgi:hypothetical protein
MLTVEPEPRCTISKMAGGTASITEPPTLRRLLVYIPALHKFNFYITHSLKFASLLHGLPRNDKKELFS